MDRYKVSKNFNLDELINPTIYKRWGAKSIRYIDPRLIWIAQYIRDEIQRPVTINNWANGRTFKNSGLRWYKENKYGDYSRHLFGSCIDIKVKNLSGRDLYLFVLDHFEELNNLGLTTVENYKFTRSWLHLSTETTFKIENGVLIDTSKLKTIPNIINP